MENHKCIFNELIQKIKQNGRRHANKDDQWTQDEIEYLSECKECHPEWGFCKIAQEMSDRTGRQRTRQQVHQRWNRVQRPCLNKGRWTADEETQLRCLFVCCYGDVKLISGNMISRSAVQIDKHLRVMGLIK